MENARRKHHDTQRDYIKRKKASGKNLLSAWIQCDYDKTIEVKNMLLEFTNDDFDSFLLLYSEKKWRMNL